MQVPSAQLIISCDGARVTVHPGTLIGRLSKADVVITDPRISEAHALVSLRRRSLRLLGLRGPVMVAGREVDSVALEPGLRVELADGLFMTVESVELPTHTLVLYGTAQGRVELGASTHSLLLADDRGARTLRLVAGYVPSAAAHLWYSGANLWIRLNGRDAEPIESGARWMIEGCAVCVSQVPLSGTDETVTEPSRGPIESTSLVIIARYTTVHIQREGVTSVITGKPAHLISELVRFGGKPIPWETLARQIWGGQSDREQLRDNFDATLKRCRRQLRDLEMRANLVSLDGSGNVELVLYPGDRIVDES